MTLPSPIADDEATTVRCSNCKRTVLASQLGHSTLSKIVIKEDAHDSLVTYTLLDSVLNTFLASFKLLNVNNFTEVELGVSNGLIEFKSARKIWPLLELLAKIRWVLACSCSQNLCYCSHARIFPKISLW